jgi:ribosomally synthesized peptide (two-chain TOMM family)
VITTNTVSNPIQQFGRIWPQCVARAWQDTEFREALKRDPERTLQETFQFAFPMGVKLEIVEGEAVRQSAPADVLRMVIPPAPAVDMREVALASADPCGNGHGPFCGPTLSFCC